MKCVKDQTGYVHRVTDEKAKQSVENGWSYCPKSEWKEQKRKQFEKANKKGSDK